MYRTKERPICCCCRRELPGSERRHGLESDVLGVVGLATILDQKIIGRNQVSKLGGAKDQPPINDFSYLVPGF